MTVISMPARCMPMSVSIVGLSPPLVTHRDRIAMSTQGNTGLEKYGLRPDRSRTETYVALPRFGRQIRHLERFQNPEGALNHAD